ncbi:MAG: YcgN family cysteine cluster protein [Hyphomicrobiaceae bacterium]|nr:YcgN family cysteine cluster protein [Hyphomicrobiaceae bacterium]
MDEENTDLPFWRTKSLDEMTPEEWESLCDGCGRCCLVKLVDEDDGDIHLTRLACSLLDIGTCRCSDYANRHEKMPDCLRIDLATVRKLDWLPASCAYRRLDEGRDLAWWHPLVSGSAQTVHQAGISIRDWSISEKGLDSEAYHRFIIADFEDS